MRNGSVIQPIAAPKTNFEVTAPVTATFVSASEIAVAKQVAMNPPKLKDIAVNTTGDFDQYIINALNDSPITLVFEWFLISFLTVKLKFLVKIGSSKSYQNKIYHHDPKAFFEQ